MVVKAVLWTLLTFLSGAVPYSVLVGRLIARQDIRTVGDHNPGAANVLRVAGVGWFVIAMLLDYLKATIPVGLAWFFFGITSWWIVPVALAPIAGHAFSPFLRGRGGKAVAATFGTWSGLTIGAGPILLGMLLGLMYGVVVVSGWAVILALLAFGLFVISYYGKVHPEFIAVWVGNMALLGWKHRADLLQAPGLRSWIVRFLRGAR